LGKGPRVPAPVSTPFNSTRKQRRAPASTSRRKWLQHPSSFTTPRSHKVPELHIPVSQYDPRIASVKTPSKTPQIPRNQNGTSRPEKIEHPRRARGNRAGVQQRTRATPPSAHVSPVSAPSVHQTEGVPCAAARSGPWKHGCAIEQPSDLGKRPSIKPDRSEPTKTGGCLPRGRPRAGHGHRLRPRRRVACSREGGGEDKVLLRRQRATA